MDKQKILHNLDKIAFYAELLPSLKINGKLEVLALCPFHDDTNPSLSVNVETGLFRCFACDAKGDVFTFYQKYKDCDFPTALQEIGKIAGVVEVDVKPKVVATFKYTDEAGNLLYIKERIEPGRNGRSKEFIFKHLKDGKWTLGRGCDPVLYNLPGVIKSKNAYVVEGEAKADLLNSWGLIATCLDSGANSPWRAEYLKAFESEETVTILPDKDKPGREYALRIASVLHGKVDSLKVEELKIVELPGLKEAEDIIDWSKTPGHNKDRLVGIVENAPQWTLEVDKHEQKSNLTVVDICDFLSMTFPKRDNILTPWLHRQGLCMIHGVRGLGKTYCVTGISLAVASGGNFLKWKASKPSGVLHIDGEMPAVVLQERYAQFVISNGIEATASLKIVTPDLQERGMPDLSCSMGREMLEPFLDGISLVIVDNISTLCKGGKENEAESWLPVQEWALKLRTRGISVLFIHHTGKAGFQRGTSRREDVLDSVIHLKKPSDYKASEGARFEVHFEKSRGIYGDDVKPFEAMLITGFDGRLEWVVKDLDESLNDKVISLLQEGLTQKEIAEELKISKGTVSKYKSRNTRGGQL